MLFVVFSKDWKVLGCTKKKSPYKIPRQLGFLYIVDHAACIYIVLSSPA
jgi:hypothetical protein